MTLPGEPRGNGSIEVANKYVVEHVGSRGDNGHLSHIIQHFQDSKGLNNTNTDFVASRIRAVRYFLL